MDEQLLIALVYLLAAVAAVPIAKRLGLGAVLGYLLAGIVIGPADFRYTVETANGKVPAAAAKIDTLQIGRIVVEDVDAVVLADKALGETLIGVSFLKRLGRYQVEGDTLFMMQ